MAKALFVCYKNPQNTDFKPFSHALAERLKPDNATTYPPYIHSTDRTFTLIYSPSPSIPIDGPSFLLGIADQKEGLFVPDSEMPYGSYAIFRVGDSKVEVAADYASSRTLWYYQDDEKFIASTSQRMIVAFLGELDFNEKSCGWFLSSGALGPLGSWDKRINIVPPRVRLLLDRNSWELEIDKGKKFDFKSPPAGDKDDHAWKDELKASVDDVMEGLDINPAEWTLALSGGMDSRSLLYYLQSKDLRAVTWGNSASMDYKSNDARIGKRLAELCGVPHSYAVMDYQKGSFPSLMERFLCASECRIDHLAAYLDGLDFWGKQSATKRGIVRGYDAFGRKPPVASIFQVKRANNLINSDDAQMNVPAKIRVTDNDLPEHFRRKEGEVLEDWRDRLWLLHRTPVVTSALEDIKLAYVEVINPLLSEPIVHTIQQLPISLREDKRVWEMVVSEMFPGIPFASRDAIQEVGEILILPEVKEHICSYLKNHPGNEFFPKSWLDDLADNYDMGGKKSTRQRRLRKLIVAYLPKPIENMIRRRIKPGPLSNRRIAIRTFMALKNQEMLTADAQLSQMLG